MQNALGQRGGLGQVIDDFLPGLRRIVLFDGVINARHALEAGQLALRGFQGQGAQAADAAVQALNDFQAMA